MIPSYADQIMYVEVYDPDVPLNGYGDETCFKMVKFCGRYSKRTRLARAEDGERLVTTHKIWTLYPLKENDRVWIPNADPKNEEHGIQVQAVEYKEYPRFGRYYYRAIL